ncbi:hypothetical protein FNV43_RR21305 [Rhamnella rubrinervis]|uniref:Cytochrome P450 n=1 Tax=Rhamnella rubrinervis TaxID=2594499 RepID=A0A8K0DVZ9_9ROSA|nr:hypothetical protein FNV43_RR21305 [Rhamnella rubrinervis]
MSSTIIVIPTVIVTLCDASKARQKRQEWSETSTRTPSRTHPSETSTKLDYVPVLGALDLQESFRLHPIAPLLAPASAARTLLLKDIGYKKKSRIIVNTWAIGHDQNVWSNNVEEFYPERFMKRDTDVLGPDFELSPFGSGRVKCSGAQSGLTTVRLVLAELRHCFKGYLMSCHSKLN